MKKKWETAVLDEDVRHVEPITRRVSKPEVPRPQSARVLRIQRRIKVTRPGAHAPSPSRQPRSS